MQSDDDQLPRSLMLEWISRLPSFKFILPDRKLLDRAGRIVGCMNELNFPKIFIASMLALRLTGVLAVQLRQLDWQPLLKTGVLPRDARSRCC